MEHIRDILVNVVDAIETKKEDTPSKIFSIWESVVGVKIARHTKPYRFKKNKLYITVDEATWAYELSQKYKIRLIDKLNKKLAGKVIHDIYFRIGEINIRNSE